MIFRKLFSSRKGEHHFSDFFSSEVNRLKACKVVFDIGAHHGNFISKMKTMAPNSKIHAFEPFAKSYEILHDKFKDDKDVSLNNAAVSNKSGQALFYSNVSDETNSLFRSSEVNDSNINSLTKNVSSTYVSTITLDEYVQKNNIEGIDFIKIDTQGNTFEVLDGAKKLLENKSIKTIYAETEFIEIYEKEKRFSEIEIFLRQFGYQLEKFYNINYTESGVIAWADALFSIKP